MRSPALLTLGGNCGQVAARWGSFVSCLALVLVLALIVGTPVGLRADDLPTAYRSIGDRGLSFDLQIDAPVERSFEVEGSTDGANWSSLGFATEIIPGYYRFIDGTAGVDARFYRAVDRGPFVPDTWSDNYAVTPQDGDHAGLLPLFEWQPFPSPVPQFYELNVYEFRIGPGGRLIPPDGPLLTRGGLLETRYSWQTGDPPLDPLCAYGYTVSTECFGFNCGGNLNFFVPFGGAGHQPTDWGKRMKLISELVEQLDQLEEDLDGNQLIQEIKLIEKLIGIIQNKDLLQDFVVAILESRFEELLAELASVDTAITILCFLEDALEVLALDAETQQKKDDLEAFKDGIGEVKQALKDGKDISEAIGDLEDLIEEVKAFISDPVTFLLDALKSKIEEKIEEVLIRKLGEAAAGSLMSIAINLALFADAIITVVQMQEVFEEINRLLVTGIAGTHPALEFDPNGFYAFPVQPGQEDCIVTIEYKKICFRQSTAEGAGPYEGTWEGPTSIPFASGPTPKSGAAGGPAFPVRTVPPSKGWRHCPTPVDPNAVKCQDGPCVVFVETTWVCPDGSSGASRVFVGVVKACP